MSKLNTAARPVRHDLAVTVILTDAYIMAVSAGWITDLRIFN